MDSKKITNPSKKILTVLTLVGALTIAGEQQTAQAVKLDQFEEPEAFGDEEYVQIEQQQESSTAGGKKPADSKKLQTKDEENTGDLVEQLSQALAKKQEDAPDADDFVKRDNAEPPKEAPEKEQTDAEAIADPSTSVAHLAEIVRANNAKEKEA